MGPPVVLVCGWTNADNAQVESYMDMYKALGYRTMMLCSRGIDFFLPERWVHRSAVEQIKQYLSEQNGETLEIIPHVLSNGGCRSWYCFENQLIHARIPFRVASIVFDSCPSIPGTNSEDPFTTHLHHSPIIQRLLVHGYIWSWVVFSLQLLLWLTGRKHPFTLHYLRYLIRDASVPKLFLYSTADELVGSSNIQGAMQTAQSMGSQITSVNFEVSDHVSHFTSNPVLYTSSVQTFLSKNVR